MSIIKNPSLSSQFGFTLIEIMIVVAIISILAGIVSLSYQSQVKQAQMIAIYQELNNFRLPYQTLVNEGVGVTDFSPRGLNIPEQSKYCQFEVTEPNLNGTTADAVKCTI